jgi:hypothetical protein
MIIDNPLFSEEIPEKGATTGHLRFHLKHASPDDLAVVGFCTNVTASLLFERLQAQGTNIIISLNKENSRVDVLARAEDDGLNLIWTPKTLEAAQLNEIAERIKNKTFLFDKEASPKTVDVEKAAQPAPAVQKESSEEEEDYLVKQLHRIP